MRLPCDPNHFRRKVTNRLVVAAAIAISTISAGPPNDSTKIRTEGVTERNDGTNVWVDRTLKKLTMEEKVGQMLQVRYYADYEDFYSPPYLQVREQIRKYHIGSAILGLHFQHSIAVRVSPVNLAKVNNQLQRDSEVPLLLATDLERSVASRLDEVPPIPWPMAFGAIGLESEARHLGALTAREARAVGINWAFAPVADINSNPANPIINIRSFGEDPAKVSALATAFIRGAHENGLLTTAKHFPGSGDTSVDSHRDIASIDQSLDHLRKIEFAPFRAAINAKVDSIMLGHARVPALEPDQEKISTISSRVVTDTLKGELGFKGLILTDALEMKGLTKLYDPKEGSPTARAAVDAIKAGCDVIMVPQDLDGAFHAILNAVYSGEIPESRIDESVRKVLAMKASVGLDKSRFVDLEKVAKITSNLEDMAFAQRIADEAVTLVRDKSKLLPVPTSLEVGGQKDLSTDQAEPKPKVEVIFLADLFDNINGHEFEKAFRQRRRDANFDYIDDRVVMLRQDEILEKARLADRIIVVAFVSHTQARQTTVNGKSVSSFGLHGLSGQLLDKILSNAADKIIVLALGSPYLIEGFPQIQAYICTYAMTTASEISAAKALFGEIQNHAKLPITLPGIAPRGFSLPWPAAQQSYKIEH